MGIFFNAHYLLYNSTMNIETLVYINLAITLLLVLCIILLGIKHIKMDRLRREFFASGLKKDLEQILVDQNRGITKLNQELDALNESLTELHQKNKSNIQKIGFMRFNPFDDSGGNISFALALLDAHDEGVIVSSLHGREGTRVYAKAVKAGKSETQLTEEEKKAIQEAK